MQQAELLERKVGRPSDRRRCKQPLDQRAAAAAIAAATAAAAAAAAGVGGSRRTASPFAVPLSQHCAAPQCARGLARQ